MSTSATVAPPSRLRRFLVATTAMGLSLLFAFAILEFGLAHFYYSNVNELRQDEFDEELGWKLKPGHYTIKAPQAFSTHSVFINQFGIRHTEFTPAMAQMRRVIVLGDSFTFGQAVSDDALFSTQLEQRLNQHGNGVTYDVVNAGVPGYGTAQELIMLKRLAAAGIVGNVYVVNLFTNDLLDNLALDYGTRTENPVQPGFTLGPDGQLAFTHKPRRELREDTNFVAAESAPRSKLFAVVKSRLQSIAQTKPGFVRFARRLGMDVKVPRVPGIISAWYDPAILDKGVPLMKALLAEMNATARSHHAILVATLIPSPMQVYSDAYGEVLRASFPDDPMAKAFLEDPLRAQRIIRRMCEELNVPLLDLYDTLEPKKDRAFYIPADGHFNEAGHAEFAASLEPFVTAHVTETK